MGGHSHARDHRSTRAARKLRSSKPVAAAEPDPVPPYPNPDSDSVLDPDPIYHESAECGYCTEEQLEDLLLKNLDFAYHEALARLAALGYGDDVALHAVLCGGHCCGPSDVITNIVTNAVDYLNNPTANSSVSASASPSSSAGGGAGGLAGFSDLRRLEEYSLAGMVCLVQQTRRGISRGDAMWCLLMGELNVGRACQIDLPPPNCCSPAGGVCSAPAGGADVAVGKGGGGFRPFVRPGGKMVNGSEDFIDDLLKELEELQLAEKSPEPDAQAERIYDLIRQAREMEAQVKERKEWAQQKALQAARKLSHDTMELRNLRTEREKRERAKKAGNGNGNGNGNAPAVTPDEATVKRLEGMEEALKKASLQVDRANAEVQRLEAENAEIRAEMEAAKLSADESIRARQEAAKREKKVRKKSQSRDRQRQQIQNEIDEVKRRQVEVGKEVEETERASKRLEARLREETKAKDETLIQLSELTKTTENTKSNAQRRIDSLRQKTNLDSQRCKDDILRLQEELSRLQSSQFINNNIKKNNNININNVGKINNNNVVRRGERKWKCVVCVKDEVSVLLLPCAHQVLCVGCSECHVSMGKARCPSCDKKVEERIRVFGVST
ncbi:hypothetical protein LUZ60_008694 [Juncus effusus]|nr:hypothetical protein LUZ60_008694 [Juncus effusus]